jgi:hypothetical protein
MDAVSLEIRNSRNITFANYHAYRVTRSIKPAVSAVKMTNSGDIRFRNVHVNAESGFATCDENGCDTYLRASKYPFENTLQDLTHKQEVREHEFAVLDIGPATAAGAGAARTVQRVQAGGRFLFDCRCGGCQGQAVFCRPPFQPHLQLVERGRTGGGARCAAGSVQYAIDKSGAILVLSSSGLKARCTRSSRPAGRPAHRHQADAGESPRRRARVVVPVNFWQNGEFRDQLNFDTYEFTTLAEMFARDVAKPKAREYVSPDGSLVLPAYRVFKQGPDDHLATASPTRWTRTAWYRPAPMAAWCSPTARRTAPSAA